MVNVANRKRSAKVRRAPWLTFDQYMALLHNKRNKRRERKTMAALSQEWNVPLSTLLDASSRGIKRYDVRGGYALRDA